MLDEFYIFDISPQSVCLSLAIHLQIKQTILYNNKIKPSFICNSDNFFLPKWHMRYIWSRMLVFLWISVLFTEAHVYMDLHQVKVHWALLSEHKTSIITIYFYNQTVCSCMQYFTLLYCNSVFHEAEYLIYLSFPQGKLTAEWVKHWYLKLEVCILASLIPMMNSELLNSWPRKSSKGEVELDITLAKSWSQEKHCSQHFTVQ